MSNLTPLKVAQAEPVPDVIRILEVTLEEAKAGRIRSVAIVGTTDTHSTTTRSSYDDNLVMLGMLQMLTQSVLRDAAQLTMELDT